MFFLFISSISFSQVRILRIWVVGEEGENLKSLVEKFEKLTGINISLEIYSWNNAFNKFITGIAAQYLPDVSMMGTTWMGIFADMEVFEDLSKYISRSKNIKPEKFFPNC